MPDEIQSLGVKSFWVQTAQTLGISTVVMCFLFYWAYQTITWEREQMIPCIQGNKEAVNSNTDVLRTVKISLDRLNKATESLDKTNTESNTNNK